MEIGSCSSEYVVLSTLSQVGLLAESLGELGGPRSTVWPPHFSPRYVQGVRSPLDGMRREEGGNKGSAPVSGRAQARQHVIAG